MRNISTNVRIYLTRTYLRALGRVAPRLADRQALALYATPQRRSPLRTPEVPGLVATDRSFAGPSGSLVGWSWGKGPTVLLVHGWSGDAAQMARFVPPLVEAGFSALAFDQPGHGYSAGRRSNLLAFRDAISTVAKTSGRVAGVVAHSLGATATALAAASGLELPRLVLLAPPTEPTSFAWAFGRRLGLSPERIAGMLAEMSRLLGGSLESLDLVRYAPRIGVPTLLVHDDEDPEVPSHHGRAIAAAAPSVQFLPTRGLGHHGLLKAPAIVETAIEFLAQGLPQKAAALAARSA